MYKEPGDTYISRLGGGEDLVNGEIMEREEPDIVGTKVSLLKD